MVDQSEKDDNEGLSLRVDLKSEIAKYLIDIMDERSFRYYAEAIRYCIIETAKETEFKLDEVYWQKLKQYLGYDFVKTKYRITNSQSFVNKALDVFFDKIEQENESIMSFDVKSQLNDEELEVALALIECQQGDPNELVKLETLAKSMNRRNHQQLQEILDAFVRRGILSKKSHKNTIYYHAKSIR